jgi:hypothetical protein
MAKRKKARDQQTVHEDTRVKELLVELQAIEERRQYAVRWHTLMNQHCQLEIPVQYERLWRRSPTRPEEPTHDHRRGTHTSRRRRIPHSRV